MVITRSIRRKAGATANPYMVTLESRSWAPALPSSLLVSLISSLDPFVKEVCHAWLFLQD